MSCLIFRTGFFCSYSANHLQCQSWGALNLHPRSTVRFAFDLSNKRTNYYFFLFLHVLRGLARGSHHVLSVEILLILKFQQPRGWRNFKSSSGSTYTQTHTASFMALKGQCDSLYVFFSCMSGLLCEEVKCSSLQCNCHETLHRLPSYFHPINC